MRVLAAAAIATALATVPAYAQMAGKRPHGDDRAAAPKAAKVDEKAYKAALEKIPDSREKYDPWGGMRQGGPGKK